MMRVMIRWWWWRWRWWGGCKICGHPPLPTSCSVILCSAHAYHLLSPLSPSSSTSFENAYWWKTNKCAYHPLSPPSPSSSSSLSSSSHLSSLIPAISIFLLWMLQCSQSKKVTSKQLNTTIIIWRNLSTPPDVLVGAIIISIQIVMILVIVIFIILALFKSLS